MSSSTSTGISQSTAESIARRYADKALRDAQRYTDQKVNEIMRDIDQMSRELQRSIETQTAAIIASVGTTTAAVMSTKDEVEQAKGQITLQLRSELQLELGRKLNVARSASSKFKQFFEDIKSRFDKSLQGVFINRNEYDVRFIQIFEEYEKKIRTIGEHIFQIRDEIKLVEEASSESLETIHSLPLEVDLYRLKLRSEELDQTIQLLEASRLQEIKSSLSKLQRTTDSLSFNNLNTSDDRIGIEALLVQSRNNKSDLLMGADAQRSPGASVELQSELLSNADNCLDENLQAILERGLEQRQTRDLNSQEYQELQEAINTLSEDGIISPDDAAFAEAVINSKNIKTYA